MTILALEFSSVQRSVAVARDGKVLAEAIKKDDARATNAFGLVEKVLDDSKINREEIEAVAVGLGPGSYTGIRAAIALAQGWRLARKIKLTGIGSMAALAAQAQAAKIFGRINVVVDAQRGEFYLATWKISATELTEISPLKIVPATAVDLERRADEIFVGSETINAMYPSAAALAHLAFKSGRFELNEVLQPIYLRETNFIKLKNSVVG
jgi:tRNA threonylcarbamoyladenosine biosynthesis protein TsaB